MVSGVIAVNEIEDKYKKFCLDGEMVEMFSQPSIGIEGEIFTKPVYSITTILIDSTGTRIEESKDAKLV